MAGYMNTKLTSASGGILEFIGWAVDPEGDQIQQIEVYAGGLPTGLFLNPFDTTAGVFWLQNIPIAPGVPPNEYLFELVATDERGGESTLWPYLNIHSDQPGASWSYSPPAVTTFLSKIRNYLNAADDLDRPVILEGGYYDTHLHEVDGGLLTMLAIVQDTQNDVSTVEVYYEGSPTGLLLYDDGIHGDFGANDGVYGLTMNFGAGVLAGTGGISIPLEIVATDQDGNRSTAWPYLTVE